MTDVKPQEGEAVQFTGHNCLEVIRFIGGPWENLELHNTDLPVIQSGEGGIVASPGDWIIKDGVGGLHLCTRFPTPG